MFVPVARSRGHMESRQGSALPLTASICFGDFQMLSNVRPGALRRRRALIARTCSTPSKPRSGSYRACIIAMIDGEETDVTGNILPPDAVFLCGDFSSPWDRPMQPIPIGDTVELPNSRACMGLLPHSHFNSCFLKKSRMDMAPIASAIADTIGVAHKICSGPKSMRMTKNRAISRVPLLSRDSTKGCTPCPMA